jgi:hypothetical protein
MEIYQKPGERDKAVPGKKGSLKLLFLMSRLKPSNLPIDGVEILTDGYSLLFLSVRLPADRTSLKSQIIRQFEGENAEHTEP